MTDENLLLTVVFQTLARCRAGSTVTQEQLHEFALKSSYEYSQARGMTEDDKYALCLNAQQTIKDDWNAYVTVSS